MYNYSLKWSKVDREYIGLCKQFPSLSFLHENKLEAIKGIRKLVRIIVKDIQLHGM